MKVGVIGTGTLGPSIAQMFSQCDQVEKVYLCKGRESSTRTGLEAIQSSFNKLKRKIRPGDRRQILGENRDWIEIHT